MSRIVILGDIGVPGEYHAGDEAMAAATVGALVARTGCEVVAISGDPTDTRERYGWQAVSRIGFDPAAGRTAWEARLAAVEATVAGSVEELPWDDAVWDVIAAVASSDAVIISGGGNLNSSWPEHIYERAAMATIARAHSRPLVVTGQTLGPHLTARDGELVAGIVTSAVVVSVREAASVAVARALGVDPARLHQLVDDGASDVLLGSAVDRDDAVGKAVITFAESAGVMSGDSYPELALSVVQSVIDVTRLPVLLVPHKASLDGRRDGDISLHDRIASELSGVESRDLIAGTEPQLCASSSLVVSTRYHPAVWGLASAVPSASLVTDAYTSTKITGAYRNYGVDAWALPIVAASTDLFERALSDLWERRVEVRAHLADRAAVHREQQARWWDYIAAVVDRKSNAEVPAFVEGPDIADGSEAPTSRRLRGWADSVSSGVTAMGLGAEGIVAERDGLASELAGLRDVVSEAESEVDRARAALEAARVSHLATQELLERKVAKARTQRKRSNAASGVNASHVGLDPDLYHSELAAARAELIAIQRSRTMRYTAAPRRAYGWIRARTGKG